MDSNFAYQSLDLALSPIGVRSLSPGGAINPEFSAYEEHILFNLNNKNRDDISYLPNDEAEKINRYSVGEYSELYLRCLEHERIYSKPIDKNNIIALTHPLCMHKTEGHLLTTDEQLREADSYLAKLDKLFQARPWLKENANFVLFETAHHYAAVTSLLMKSGLFDKTIFTEYDSGKLMDTDELNTLQDKVWFVGGGYNGRCLFFSNEPVRKVISLDEQRPTRKRFYAIKDLVLNKPVLNKNERDFFKGIIEPELITDGRRCDILGVKFFPPEEVISLESTIEKLRSFFPQLEKRA